jgi:hypothetical protein
MHNGFFAALRMTRVALRMNKGVLRMTGETLVMVGGFFAVLRMTGGALRMIRVTLFGVFHFWFSLGKSVFKYSTV